MKARRLATVALLFSCLASIVIMAQTGRAGGTVLLGIYYGNQGWKMEQVGHMEAWQGKKHAVVNLFTNWCNRSTTINNLFAQQLVNVWNNRNVPMITWEPYLCSATSTPADVEVRAARGEYDAYFNTWADRLKSFLSGPDGVLNTADDRRAYLRLGHEMNGDWYPWGAAMGNNKPTDYVDMWRRVKGIFDTKGLTSSRLQWMWTVNHDDVGAFTAEQYYPGDAYVDWTAIDGYNWGESQTWSDWKTPAQSYDAMIGRLRRVTLKPLALTEVGSSTSTTTGVSVPAKSQWIADLFSYVLTNDIRMVAWFNEDKETDWAVFGGGNGDGSYKGGKTTYKTYAAYRTAISHSAIIGPDTTNLRLLIDTQFAGQ